MIREEKALVRSVLELSETDDVVFDDEGWVSRVYLVNGGRIVFKFARSPAVRGGYRNEIAALELLQQHPSGVVTPTVRWQVPDNRYFGYEGIVGTQLGGAQGLSHEQRLLIGESIGNFVRRLQSLTLDDAETLSVEDEIAEYQYKCGLASEVIRDRFSIDEARVLDTFFGRTLPEQMRRLGSVPRLGHGDLGPHNIIVTPDHAVGVIDFNDVAYYDQSQDFTRLNDSVILEAALKAYGDSELLRRKVAVRVQALPVLDLPFYIGKADNAGIETCIARIRSALL